MTRRRRTAAAVETDPARNAARKRTYALIPFPSTTCTSLPLAISLPLPAVTLKTLRPPESLLTAAVHLELRTSRAVLTACCTSALACI